MLPIMSSEPRNITITRKGQQFGPYPEAVARNSWPRAI